MFDVVVETTGERRSIDDASAYAIARAKTRGDGEVMPDDLIAACLRAIARFGVVEIGGLLIDLEALGIDWLREPEKSQAKVSYSDGFVRLLDLAALIAKPDGAERVQIEHVLAAFAHAFTKNEDGIMGKLKRTGVTSPALRAAAARIRRRENESQPAGPAPIAQGREYLSPEEAAAELGVHVQTLRGYIRSGKLPAARLAGERAIRVRRQDLYKLLEPFQAET